MSAITTHVLDLSSGQPARGVAVELAVRQGDEFRALATFATDADGRVRTLLPQGEPLPSGEYRLRFFTAAYFAARGQLAFHPFIDVVFSAAAGGHHHVPLLLSPFGYSTYRGS